MSGLRGSSYGVRVEACKQTNKQTKPFLWFQDQLEVIAPSIVLLPL